MHDTSLQRGDHVHVKTHYGDNAKFCGTVAEVATWDAGGEIRGVAYITPEDPNLRVFLGGHDFPISMTRWDDEVVICEPINRKNQLVQETVTILKGTK